MGREWSPEEPGNTIQDCGYSAHLPFSLKAAAGKHAHLPIKAYL